MNFEPILPLIEEPEALIPPPVPVNDFEDVYCVGASSSERWRLFIDCENWHPEKFHDKLMRKRAYHARCAYEAALLVSYTNSNWLSTPAFELIRDLAVYEMRRVEFEIFSFQSTCGMIGLDSSDRSKLFTASVVMYTTMIWIAEHVLFTEDNRTKSMRKAFGELKDRRPYSVDGKNTLCENIDFYALSIRSFMTHDITSINAQKGRFLKDLLLKLQQCILQMDILIQVIP